MLSEHQSNTFTKADKIDNLPPIAHLPKALLKPPVVSVSHTKSHTRYKLPHFPARRQLSYFSISQMHLYLTVK